MTQLTEGELAAHNPPATVKEDGTVVPPPHSLDDTRAWLKVTCPNGHTALVADHEGGSEADCHDCGVRFPYGQLDVETVEITGSEVASTREVTS